MRLHPGCADDAITFVQQQRPSAQLLNRAPDRLSFSIPQEVTYQLANATNIQPDACQALNLHQSLSVLF